MAAGDIISRAGGRIAQGIRNRTARTQQGITGLFEELEEREEQRSAGRSIIKADPNINDDERAQLLDKFDGGNKKTQQEIISDVTTRSAVINQKKIEALDKLKAETVNLQAKTAQTQAETAALKAKDQVVGSDTGRARVNAQEDFAMLVSQEAANVRAGNPISDPRLEPFINDQSLVNVGNILNVQGKGSVDPKDLAGAVTPEIKDAIETQTNEAKLRGILLSNSILADEVQNGPKQDVKAGDLRKEFSGRNEIKDLRKVQAAMNKVDRAGTGEQTPASDLALVFNFMKILDPGSTVREGEFDNARRAKAALVRAEDNGEVILPTVKDAVNRAVEGLLLRDTQRLDFVDQARKAFGGQLETAKPTIKQFAELEKLRGFKEGVVITPEDRELIVETEETVEEDSAGNVEETQTVVFEETAPKSEVLKSFNAGNKTVTIGEVTGSLDLIGDDLVLTDKDGNSFRIE